MSKYALACLLLVACTSQSVFAQGPGTKGRNPRPDNDAVNNRPSNVNSGGVDRRGLDARSNTVIKPEVKNVKPKINTQPGKQDRKDRKPVIAGVDTKSTHFSATDTNPRTPTIPRSDRKPVIAGVDTKSTGFSAVNTNPNTQPPTIPRSDRKPVIAGVDTKSTGFSAVNTNPNTQPPTIPRSDRKPVIAGVDTKSTGFSAVNTNPNTQPPTIPRSDRKPVIAGVDTKSTGFSAVDTNPNTQPPTIPRSDRKPVIAGVDAKSTGVSVINTNPRTEPQLPREHGVDLASGPVPQLDPLVGVDAASNRNPHSFSAVDNTSIDPPSNVDGGRIQMGANRSIDPNQRMTPERSFRLKLAEIDRMRDRAIEAGNVKMLQQANALEREARIRFAELTTNINAKTQPTDDQPVRWESVQGERKR